MLVVRPNCKVPKMISFLKNFNLTIPDFNMVLVLNITRECCRGLCVVVPAKQQVPLDACATAL